MKNLFFNDYLPLDELYKPIRSKIDIIYLILSVCRYVNNFQSAKTTYSDDSKLIMHVDKMNRIFIISSDKIFSIHFPFSIEINENVIDLYYNDILVDNDIIYPLLKFLSISNLEDSSFENMFDIFIDVMYDFEIQNNDFIDSCWSVLIYLLSFEDAYLRYDIDDDPKRLDAEKHPLHHLDIYYSNTSTFKIGLDAKLSHDELIDILNIKSNCKFLK